MQERSQGLSLRNPWIDSLTNCIPEGCENMQVSPDPFLASLRDGALSQCNQGFEDSTPGYDLNASGVIQLRSGALASRSIAARAICSSEINTRFAAGPIGTYVSIARTDANRPV